MSSQDGAGPQVAILASDLDLTAAQALHEFVRGAGLSHQNIIFDGSNVERIGTPAVQVLLAGARFFAVEGQTLTIRQPSADLTEALDDLGLWDEFQRWCRC